MHCKRLHRTIPALLLKLYRTESPIKSLLFFYFKDQIKPLVIPHALLVAMKSCVPVRNNFSLEVKCSDTDLKANQKDKESNVAIQTCILPHRSILLEEHYVKAMMSKTQLSSSFSLWITVFYKQRSKTSYKSCTRNALLLGNGVKIKSLQRFYHDNWNGFEHHCILQKISYSICRTTH